jgi:hypothetical protein
MKKRPAVVLGGLLIAASGVAAFVTVAMRTQEASAVGDPRLEPPIVRLATATQVRGVERGFTGVIGARVQSNLGFRVPGKIVERLVNTQLHAVDFAIAAEEAVFGLSEVNWGIIPGGIVSWNLTELMLPRHAMYYAVTGESFDGKRAVELGLANFAVPKERLRDETVTLAKKLMKLNPGVVRYTKEAIWAVQGMTHEQARDYLRSKQDSLARNDEEIRDRVGMTKFLDEKSYRPGHGPYQREENP